MSELFGWVGWVGSALCCGCTCLEQLDLNLSTPQNCGYSGISVEFSRSSCVHENWFSFSLQWGGDSPFPQVVIVAVIRSLEHHQFLSLHHIQRTCTMTCMCTKVSHFSCNITTIRFGLTVKLQSWNDSLGFSIAYDPLHRITRNCYLHEW